MKVFIDSDVITSSVISQAGAAHFLLTKNLENFYISNYSKKEIEIVAKRMKLDSTVLDRRMKLLLQCNLIQSISIIKNEYSSYVINPNDTHIVAGAKTANAQFLITYNKKDYNIEQINRDFSILVLSPGEFLQYLRSFKK